MSMKLINGDHDGSSPRDASRSQSGPFLPLPGPWQRLQGLPRWRRRIVKMAVLAVVVFLVLYPDPRLFVRHVGHLLQINTLPDPDHPAIRDVNARFEAFLTREEVDADDPPALLEAVEAFVHEEVPYSWDWDVWGVADYLPTLDELFEAGTEDCDGRALLAATLLRHRGIDAQIVGDPRHLWVSTPFGDTMGPLGEPVFRFDEDGLHVDWARLLDPRPLALGIAVFPFMRETIILLTLWFLLLPDGITVRRAGGSLLLMFGALVLLRLAGHIHLLELGDPPDRHRLGTAWYGLLAWALLHLVGGVVLLRWRSMSTKHTVRSVPFIPEVFGGERESDPPERNQPAPDRV